MLPTGFRRSDLGIEVADYLIGKTDVGLDHPEQVFVSLSRLEESHRRNAQTFLEHVAGVRRPDDTADVG